jgi:hypothetical protein
MQQPHIFQILINYDTSWYPLFYGFHFFRFFLTKDEGDVYLTTLSDAKVM